MWCLYDINWDYHLKELRGQSTVRKRLKPRDFWLSHIDKLQPYALYFPSWSSWMVLMSVRETALILFKFCFLLCASTTGSSCLSLFLCFPSFSFFLLFLLSQSQTDFSLRQILKVLCSTIGKKRRGFKKDCLSFRFILTNAEMSQQGAKGFSKGSSQSSAPCPAPTPAPASSSSSCCGGGCCRGCGGGCGGDSGCCGSSSTGCCCFPRRRRRQRSGGCGCCCGGSQRSQRSCNNQSSGCCSGGCWKPTELLRNSWHRTASLLLSPSPP